MGHAGRNEHGASWTHVHDPIDEPEPQRAFQDVPCLIIEVMDVQLGRATAPPFVDLE